MNKLAIFAALAAPVILSSCSDKGYWDEYVPTDVEYAIITANQSYTLNPNSTKISPVTLLVSRGTTVGDVSMPVKVTSDVPYLTASAPATVNFTDGSSQSELTVNITADFDAAPWFNPVDSVSISLDTEHIAPSSKGVWKAKVTFANSLEVGTAQLKSQLLAYLKNGGAPGAAVVDTTVSVWARSIDPGYLMIQNPYGTKELPHALDLVLDEDWQMIDWNATEALCDIQTIFNTGSSNAPVYMTWGGQDSEVGPDGLTLKFYTVTNTDGTGYFPSQYQWVETYTLPEGWNAVSE
ncbi:MAG: hypothetical protein K2G47_10440 [Muribaculum sp.]|nr:hypothetical protein [Muribaculum sp.]